ncbi:RNA 2'-phosphotransferase [Umezawaea tangerina]|uniref:Probable RNA 2'-phosphotransferase n=1 Tax=Umezawaea tangerina TaxID=84725 RepID=A0A2T0T9W3_9PSEU|nr:RNA 2'-phosphotransferase [Umezawaea tangerina]PRY42429.1 putative RNA 2'-phosphotransferase [Umezawaea tangerina]
MQEKDMIRLSKRLSKRLRHSPEAIGLRLDPEGWVGVDDLLAALGGGVTRAQLDEVVARNDKQRFTIDGDRIRANQGHSVPVDLGLPVSEPPPVLYHGTVGSSLPAIHRDGLKPMNRHDVHLSPTVETAQRVGARRGKPVVLTVDAAAMRADGHEFRVSANGVWLVPHVPPRYLSEQG